MKQFKGLLYRKIGIICPILAKRKMPHCINSAFQKYNNSTTGQIFTNITHVSKLYHSNEEILKKLYNVMKSSTEISNLDILHESSELGLPFRIKFTFKNILVSYDGLMYSLEKQITDDEFDLDEIKNLFKYREFDIAIRFLEKFLNRIQPESHNGLERNYYYIQKNQNLKVEKIDTNKKFLIKYNDPNYITSNFSTKESSWGKINYVYCNDYQDIIEDEALHLFLSDEISRYQFSFEHIKEKLVKIEENLIEETRIFNSLLKIRRKFSNWSSLKRDISYIIRINSYFSKLSLVSKSIINVVDSNKNYFLRLCESNIIAISGKKIDTKKKYPYIDLGMQFLEYNDGLKISSQPKPSSYSYSQHYLAEIEGINLKLKELYNMKKDLLNVFNIELVFYTLILTFLGMIINTVLQLIL